MSSQYQCEWMSIGSINGRHGRGVLDTPGIALPVPPPPPPDCPGAAGISITTASAMPAKARALITRLKRMERGGADGLVLGVGIMEKCR